MRVSADRTDPGYSIDCLRVTKVTLNGEEVRDVLTADEEEGFIISLLRDKSGCFIPLDEEAGYATTRIEGKVKITLSGKPDLNRDQVQLV